MKAAPSLEGSLLKMILRICEKRDIFPLGVPYLTRWILFEWAGMFGIYVHKFWASDYERALHDHPWNFISIVLKGSYLEHSEHTGCLRTAGSIAYRPCTHKHRVELVNGPVWTLMLVSGRKRRWGFWPNGVWCWWRKFNQEANLCGDEIINLGGED
jgi:hypothetical protein